MTGYEAEGRARHEGPVRAVAPERLAVGGGVLPVYASADWSRPMPEVRRAVVIVHGRLRDADAYLRAGEAAVAAGRPQSDGCLLVAPQLLAEVDVRQHRLPPETLRWGLNDWMGGEAAERPVGVSSFAALDAILARLVEPGRFAGLEQVVVAGHSGGGQVVQRYAVLGRGETALAAAGVGLRSVVANPSSYVYFSRDRPVAPAAGCAGFNRWKYGLESLPDYAQGADPAALEADYVRRDVVYLWGGDDCDPDQPALDRSCEACAQGPHRLARGQAYLAYLRARHPGLAHRAAVVPGVGHDAGAMFASAAGLAALFGDGLRQ